MRACTRNLTLHHWGKFCWWGGGVFGIAKLSGWSFENQKSFFLSFFHQYVTSQETLEYTVFTLGLDNRYAVNVVLYFLKTFKHKVEMFFPGHFLMDL